MKRPKKKEIDKVRSIEEIIECHTFYFPLNEGCLGDHVDYSVLISDIRNALIDEGYIHKSYLKELISPILEISESKEIMDTILPRFVYNAIKTVAQRYKESVNE